MKLKYALPQRSKPGRRPLLPVNLLGVSVSNASVTCLSAGKQAKRQLLYPANANSRYDAVILEWMLSGSLFLR